MQKLALVQEAFSHGACVADVALRADNGSSRPNSGIYAWEYEQTGRELNIKVGGQHLCNDVDLIVEAALAGHGLAHLIADRVLPFIADGTLVRVLEDWCDPFDGYYLYYPSHRQPSGAFGLLLEALRYRS